MPDPENFVKFLAKALPSNESRFEVTVEGMMCVKCTEKVDKALSESEIPMKNVKIDFISNRVLLTLPNKDQIDAIGERLKAAGFGMKSYKDITHTQIGDRRMITLNITKGEKESISRALSLETLPNLDEEPRFNDNKCMITYNPASVRGSEIIKKLKELPEYIEERFAFTIENCFEEDISNIKFSDFTRKQLNIILAINLLNITISFIPEDAMFFPAQLGMFSYYFLSVLLLTILNLKYVGFNVYATCIRQLIASFHLNMLTLVSIGSGLALIFGFIYTTLGIMHCIANGGMHTHFFLMNASHMFHTSATIFTALVVGKYIEGKIKKRIYSRIDDLKQKLQVKVDSVQRIVPRNKNFAALLSEDLHPMLIEKDDYIVIKAPGMIPFDGFIEKGTLKVVENIQYGWEKAESRTKGHPIISGSQIVEVQDSAIIKVTAPLEKTLAGRLFYEIKEAASGSSGDRDRSADILAHITKYFISVVLLAALFTLLGWGLALHFNWGSDDVDFSYPFEKAISVLVASCPCALGIAIPMVYAIALRKGFKTGVLIKDTASLDTLLTIDTVIFDKTGTITGTYNIKEVRNVGNRYDDASLWELVSLLEKDHLQHPVGLALFQEAVKRLSNLEKAKYAMMKNEQAKDSHEYFASEGIIEKAILANDSQIQVALGNQKLLQRLNIEQPAEVDSHLIIDLDRGSASDSQREIKDKGTETNLYLCVDNQVQLRIILSLKENLKNNALNVISQIQNRGKEVQILSGDARVNAVEIGRTLGIPESCIFAEVDPEGKERHVKGLVDKGRKVMMVGDGINDIKAFKAASLSCSINFKSSQNLSFSDFIVINNDLETISGAFNLAEVTSYFKKGILVCALLYNVPVILAASGAFKEVYGIDLEAYLACWTMVLFSLLLTGIANLMEFINIKKPWMQNSKVITFLKRLLFINNSKKKPFKSYIELTSDDANHNQPVQSGEDN